MSHGMDGGSSRDASAPRDASASVSEAVRSLDTRLDDLRRETSWRAIEGALDEKPAITVAPRTWRLPVFALATAAVIVALIVLPKPARDGAADTTTATGTNANGANENGANANAGHANGANAANANAANANAANANGANASGAIASSMGTNGMAATNGHASATQTNGASAMNGGGATDPPTTLSAAAGQRTIFERDGVILTLVGPSVATMTREADLVRVSVTKGLVVADRTPTAPALAVDAGDNHVVSRDARFAVRVEPTMVVLGAGEQAQQIVERHAIEMGALPVPEPTTARVQSPTKSAMAAANAPAKTDAKKTDVEPASTGDRAPMLPELRMDATELYRRAEAALAIRDPAGARELLERLLAEYPRDSRADAARYDLALIARSFGQRQRALELIDALIANGTDENLKAAARRLRPTLTLP